MLLAVKIQSTAVSDGSNKDVNKRLQVLLCNYLIKTRSYITELKGQTYSVLYVKQKVRNCVICL